MNKLNRISAFVFGILATVFVSSFASANTTPDTQNAVSASNNNECVLPINRDYHDVLSAYKNNTSGDYKFSGCGGVL